MKLFNCDNCGSALFFENVICLHCGSTLAFLPDRMELAALEPVPSAGDLWRQQRNDPASTRHYRLCRNNSQHQSCNFAVPLSDPNALCVSCRLTVILPDLAAPGNRERWYRVEAASEVRTGTLPGAVSRNGR